MMLHLHTNHLDVSQSKSTLQGTKRVSSQCRRSHFHDRTFETLLSLKDAIEAALSQKPSRGV